MKIAIAAILAASLASPVLGADGFATLGGGSEWDSPSGPSGYKYVGNMRQPVQSTANPSRYYAARRAAANVSPAWRARMAQRARAHAFAEAAKGRAREAMAGRARARARANGIQP